jgi:hypothetical protein
MNRCRECNAPIRGAHVEQRATAFCSEACADVFFHTWAVRTLAAIARLKNPSRARTMARDAMRKARYWA